MVLFVFVYETEVAYECVNAVCGRVALRCRVSCFGIPLYKSVWKCSVDKQHTHTLIDTYNGRLALGHNHIVHHHTLRECWSCLSPSTHKMWSHLKIALGLSAQLEKMVHVCVCVSSRSSIHSDNHSYDDATARASMCGTRQRSCLVAYAAHHRLPSIHGPRVPCRSVNPPIIYVDDCRCRGSNRPLTQFGRRRK